MVGRVLGVIGRDAGVACIDFRASASRVKIRYRSLCLAMACRYARRPLTTPRMPGCGPRSRRVRRESVRRSDDYRGGPPLPSAIPPGLPSPTRTCTTPYAPRPQELSRALLQREVLDDSDVPSADRGNRDCRQQEIGEQVETGLLSRDVVVHRGHGHAEIGG
jgi:hypothetical protein